MPDKKPHTKPKKGADNSIVAASAPKTASASTDAKPLKSTPSSRDQRKRPLSQRLLPSGLNRQSRTTKLLAKQRLISIVVAVLLLSGATYAAVVYLSNTPDYVYARGIENSGKLIDNLAMYAQQLQSAPYKSMALDGSMQGRDILGHYDIDLSGTENRNGDGLFTASGDVDGMPLNSTIRMVSVGGNSLPDAYVKSKDLNALKPLIGVQGLPTFDQFDNKWIVIDHNLLESYVDNLMRIADKSIDKKQPSPSPTLAQISDALSKVQAVGKRYLFTTNSTTAVFKKTSFIGTETNDGRQLNHYRVTYNSAHLAAFLQAFGQALDGSQLNTWSREVSGGKSLSQTLSLSAMDHGMQPSSGNSGAADIWIDRDAKVITKVQFNNPSPTLSSIVVTQGHTGGNLYPFSVTYNGKDKNNSTYAATVSFTLNASTHAATFAFSNRSQTDGLLDVLDAHVRLTPSDTTIHVTTPSGATPFLTALGPSGLSDLAKP